MTIDAGMERCYAALDVAPGASAEEIKTAYLDLVKVWHPDRYQNDSPRLRNKAEEKLKAINQAYEILRTGAPVFTAAAPGPRQPPANAPAEDLRPVQFGPLWGYAGGDGRVAIPPRFDSAAPFQQGLALVSEGGRFGFIDASGGFVIYPEFAAGRGFSEGLAGVVLSVRWGYVDRDGRFVVNPLYDACGDFSAGLAAVCWRGRWGYIDRAGSFAVPPRYEEARPFAGDWAEVRAGQRWLRLNRLGEAFVDAETGQLVAG